MFDMTPTPTLCPEVHAWSIDTSVPGTRRMGFEMPGIELSGIPADRGSDPELNGPITAHWTCAGMRGTATRYLFTKTAGAAIRCRFSGRAVTLLLPMDFVPPGPHYNCGFAGRLGVRVDNGPWRELCPGEGREVPVGGSLEAGEHTLELETLEGDGAVWAVEGLRAWDAEPGFVCGCLKGSTMLTDMRADITAGDIACSKTCRNGRTGEFTVPVPAGVPVTIRLRALGWQPHTVIVEGIGPGETRRLGSIHLQPAEITPVPVRALVPQKPLVLACFAHVNIWGQEAAEWLQRRVDWINSFSPHLVLDANEVNPVYTAAALARLNCPWLTCDGNHSMPGFGDRLRPENRGFKNGPVRVVTAGKALEAARDWDRLFARFGDDDTLRIICAYEPVVPPELLARHRIRFYFYGHSLEKGYCWEEGGTRFLRKVDANTFYRVTIGPPYSFDAPVSIERCVFRRET